MENILNYETAKEIIVYSCFGAIIGLELGCVVTLIGSGVKWVIKKVKRHKEKKEETPNE